MRNIVVFTKERQEIKMMAIIYLLLFYSSFGQNKLVVDSLNNVLKLQKNDTSKVGTLNELAWELKKSNAKKAREFANTALRLSDSLEFRKGMLTSLNRIGTISIYQKEYNDAEKIYLDILDAEIKANYRYGIGRAQNQLSEIYRNKKDIKKAQKYALEALSNFEFLENKKITALICNNIGMLYQEQGLYQKAMEYFLRSLKIREATGEDKNIAYNYLNIGILSMSLKNYPKAIDYLHKGEALFADMDDSYELAKIYNNLGIAYFESENSGKALYYYKKSLAIKTKLGISGKDANLYNNIGSAYYQEHPDLALENYLKSLAIQSKNVDKDKLLDSYVNLGSIFYKKGKYKNAVDFYLKALESSKNSNQKTMQLEVLNNLAFSYSKLGQYDLAYSYANQYKTLKDSIEANYKQAINLKAAYEEQKKEKELLSKDTKIATANLEKAIIENKRKNILILSLSTGIILIALLFFAIARINKEKQKAQLAVKNQEIEKHKVEELLKKQEMKSINSMIQGQEDERKRIARDLHDRLGSILSMVKIHFKSVEENIESLKTSNIKQYEKANELLDNACDEVRKISYDMASGVLSKFGLVAAIEDLKSTIEQSNFLNVEFVAHGVDDRLDNNLEIAVYRVIQELLSNILKYAKANEITIQLLKSKNRLNVIVEDNGIGFDASQETNGMGLKNVASRVNSLSGELSIDSIKEKGTTITIDIPLNEN